LREKATFVQDVGYSFCRHHNIWSLANFLRNYANFCANPIAEHKPNSEFHSYCPHSAGLRRKRRIFDSVTGVLALEPALRDQALLDDSNLLQALGSSSSSGVDEEETSDTQVRVLLGGANLFIYEEFLQDLQEGH
jgi:hypothetical protein